MITLFIVTFLSLLAVSYIEIASLSLKRNYLYYAVEKFVEDYVDKSILNNPTIQALALVDITNVVDNKYASAFGTGFGKMPSAVGMSHMMKNMMTNNNVLNMKTNSSEELSLPQSNDNTHSPTSFISDKYV